METTQIDWVSKEVAGVLLGTIGRPLSSRRVLELAKEGRIESGRTKDPNNGQTVVRIHAGSIERYLERKRNPEPIPPPEACDEVREPQSSRALTRRESDVRELVRLVRDECANSTSAEPAHLFLTLRETVDYSGLPEATVLEMIGTGELKARDVGTGRRGGRWRIRKTVLEALL